MATHKAVKITDRVRNFEDILTLSGKTLQEVVTYPNPITRKEISTNALDKIQLIVEVYNEGKLLNWNDNSQRKWVPYFNRAHGCWVFLGSYDYASVGFGCYFCEKYLSDDAATKFIDIYNEYLPL